MAKQKRSLRLPTASGMRAVLALMSTLLFAVVWPTWVNADDHAFVVTASQITWGEGLDLKEVKCLTLNRKIGNHIYKTDYSDEPQVLDILRRYFRKKAISSTDSSCPYVLSFNIIATETRAVTFAGQMSRMLITFAITEKNPVTGSLYYEGQRFKGNYKNLYLFRSDLKPLEAFEVGLKAFVTPQVDKWEVIQISLTEI